MAAEPSPYSSCVLIADQPVRSPVLARKAFGERWDVGRLVAAAHEDGIQSVLSKDGDDEGCAGVDRQTLETLLTYCGEQRCVEDQATCGNCRLRSMAEGVGSLEEFVGQFASISVGDGGVTLNGPGSGQLQVDSLDWILRHWEGEEYWFWARRVLRKLRYGVRTVDDLIDSDGIGQGAPAVLLIEPQIPENIGMVARAMGNFGMDGLRVIRPRENWPSEKARAVASGAAAIIDEARLEPSLEAAVHDLHWVAATTARQRDMRKPVMTPEQAAQEMSRRIANGERCGILFGRERHGLESDEIALADAVVMIPINNKFASLNLGQAVLLLGYEWLKASGHGSLGRVTTKETPVNSGVRLGNDRPATKEALQGFFEHIESELERMGFFRLPHRRQVVVRSLRTMFTRMQPTEQEVRTLRGIVATLSHGKGSRRKPTE